MGRRRRHYTQGEIDAYCERHGIDTINSPSPRELYEDDLEAERRAAADAKRRPVIRPEDFEQP